MLLYMFYIAGWGRLGRWEPVGPVRAGGVLDVTPVLLLFHVDTNINFHLPFLGA